MPTHHSGSYRYEYPPTPEEKGTSKRNIKGLIKENQTYYIKTEETKPKEKLSTVISHDRNKENVTIITKEICKALVKVLGN